MQTVQKIILTVHWLLLLLTYTSTTYHVLVAAMLTRPRRRRTAKWRGMFASRKLFAEWNNKINNSFNTRYMRVQWWRTSTCDLQYSAV